MNQEEKEKIRIQALKKLIIWIVILGSMIGVLYIIDAFSHTNEEDITKEVTPNENDSEKNETMSIDEKLDKLIQNDYEFIYLITKNNETVKFEGEKTNGIVTGYKQTKDSILKYKIENQKMYEIKIDGEYLINNLYEDIDSSLLDLNYLKTIIEQISDNDIIVTEEEKKVLYHYNLTQKEEGLEIIVEENDTNIIKIVIERNNEIYELQFF